MIGMANGYLGSQKRKLGDLGSWKENDKGETRNKKRSGG